MSTIFGSCFGISLLISSSTSSTASASTNLQVPGYFKQHSAAVGGLLFMIQGDVSLCGMQELSIL